MERSELPGCVLPTVMDLNLSETTINPSFLKLLLPDILPEEQEEKQIYPAGPTAFANCSELNSELSGP